ncbi:GGDEF-domain containing protein [Erythrobacter sp. KY5]|uniref:putative bifunctional diguanylate cyclase/phosphodiesterase n=1 Tax=Erythrobacter sp. KY5 TaxID=2011159 RepID=UPI000DBF0E72|nr:EAL domain-containing protein [Erythrobacter sp. KY5]AWW74367.1 GGDEF-domain containing protein [Erythrobacter sp. KY5]
MADTNPDNPIGSAERDLVALGVAIAAIILFVATGTSVVPAAINSILGNGNSPDNLLTSALLLNIVLIIFCWRRYRDLQSEIEERRRAEERARELAEIDPLTGCLNRRSMAGATGALQEFAKVRGLAIAYVMIDLDNFKQINDMHGHSVGDSVLVQMASRIRNQLPKEARLARLGGDEFAFVTPYDPVSRERVDDLVVRLFESMAVPFEHKGISIDATISIGVTSDHDDKGLDPSVSNSDALMQRADMAMYQSKKEGKNRYFWFETSMEDELRFRHELESGIRRGLANSEFVPYYEQQVDIESGDLVGFEMLARWHSPTMGKVSPEIFIPVAEDIGVITELSDQLMAQAFADARAWHEDLTLSINISPVQLRDPWFAQKILKALTKHNFPPHRLEIEITESCLHENIGMVRSIITSLRNQGVRVSLDDFGTGYSSLEQLRTLPFDRLKIDRSFVGELRNPSNKSRIVDAIVSLGRGLDLPITAEGIEDEDILDALKKMGKLKGQGYYYGQPENAEEVAERLKRSGRLVRERVPEVPAVRESARAEEHHELPQPSGKRIVNQ